MPQHRPAASAPTVYLETFGCQMNELDSELVRGQLSALGYRFVDDDRGADVILYNTCSVREQAENKAYSRIGIVGRRKRQGEQVVLGVLGCMAERDGVDMLRRHPQIDLLCGPGELDRLPLLIDNAVRTAGAERADRDLAHVVALQGNRSRRTATLAAAEDNLELLDLSRSFDPDGAPAGGRAAYVRITRGCNKFCTYCVVPQTRGAEVHRPPDHIVQECARLADQGVIEVTLLGQTVNHYLYVHGPAVTVARDGTTAEAPQIGPGLSAFRERRPGAAGANGHRTTTFADLLQRIHDEVPAIQRLRFVTSYPRDFGDDILEVMAACPRICRYLHIPPQSGSDRILRLMNRGYGVEQYLDLLARARQRLPDVCLSGDIIVGFPTETEEDFEATADLLRRARFKNCFIFKYSPRPGTVAIDRFADDVPDEVKRRRNNALLALQAQIGAEVHAQWIGREVRILIEHEGSGRGDGSASRRLAHGEAAPSVAERSGGPAAGAAASPEWAGGVQLTVAGERRHPPLEQTTRAAGFSAEPVAMGKPDAAAPPPGGDGDTQTTSGAALRDAADRHGPDRRGTQMIGRTSGDLIVAFEVPGDLRPAGLVGRMASVHVTGASSLLLHARLLEVAPEDLMKPERGVRILRSEASAAPAASTG